MGRIEHGRVLSRLIAGGRDAIKDTVAGVLASVILIANIVSFGALMFPGELERRNSGCDLGDADRRLRRRSLDRIDDLLASARDGYRFADGCCSYPAERVGRLRRSGVGRRHGSCNSKRHVGFHGGDFPVRGIALRTRSLPMGLVFPLRPLLGRWRISGGDRLFPDRRCHPDGDRPAGRHAHRACKLDRGRRRETCQCHPCGRDIVGPAPLGEVGLRRAGHADCHVAAQRHGPSRSRTFRGRAWLVLPLARDFDPVAAVAGCPHHASDLADADQVGPRVAGHDDGGSHLARDQGIEHRGGTPSGRRSQPGVSRPRHRQSHCRPVGGPRQQPPGQHQPSAGARGGRNPDERGSLCPGARTWSAWRVWICRD